MNPFDLKGPQFLLFYIGLIVALMLLRVLIRTISQSTGLLSIVRKVRDPYKIAYIRSGSTGAIRLAVADMLASGMLKKDEGEIECGEETAEHPLQRSIQAHFMKGLPLAGLYEQSAIVKEARKLEPELVEHGFLLGESRRNLGRLVDASVLFFLVSFALVRIAQALLAGRTKLLFLIFLATVGILLTWVWRSRSVTARGQD